VDIMSFSQLLNFLIMIAPQLEQAIQTLAHSKGLPVDHPDVAAAFAQHITQGQPNDPSLS
jgi:hypothetical protein